MGNAQTLQQRRRYFIKCAAAVAAIFLVCSACAAQAAPADQPPEVTWLQEMTSNPALLTEFGQLIGKLQHDVQYPQARSESHLLQLLPESTLGYAAYPNYGEVAHESLKIFRQELKESAPLRDWYQHDGPAEFGPKAEDFLEKLYQLSQYLGDEIVMSASAEDRRPSVLFVAEVRKPGLKNALQQAIQELAGKSMPGVRVFDAQELATSKDDGPAQDLVVLVRPDYVVAALDMATLRSFNSQLDRHTREFASTPFGRRVVQAYQDGVTTLTAADLHKILSQIPRGTDQSWRTFESSGFADMKYFIWEQKSVASQGVSEMELSFTGPRRGPASWLAAPAPLGSLDFVSPKAMLATTVLIANLTQVFDDVKAIADSSNPGAFATLAQFEQGLKLSLKEDVLGRLGGEITMEVDDLTPTAPVWKAILRVKDQNSLQQTLRALLVAAPVTVVQSDEGGFTSYTLKPTSAKMSFGASYAFVDGYLIVAPNHETLAEAIRLHKSGEGLGKSKKFLSSLPAGHASGFSALLYEDPTAIAMLSLNKTAPQLAEILPKMGTATSPIVACAYGEPSAIRGASTNSGFGAGAILVVAAVAIPNLLRSRMAANEASAVGSVRTIDVAEISYSAIYPERGYAPDLATLGPDTRGPGTESADHAGLIDANLAGASCTAGAWCTKSGYRFSLTAVCKQHLCQEFVVAGTPVSSNTGVRSFCSTSDAVVRFQTGAPLSSPVTVSECQAWAPLQ
jgi:hypothetical protein